MNTIRPSVLPPTPQGSPGQDAAKLAAARAFFAAAMGQAPNAASASAPASAPVAAPAMQAARASDAPPKIPRPGSLIDIRV